MAEAPRDRTLTVLAILFALLGVSNLLKPLQLEGAETGFVLLGRRLDGSANAIVAPIFGVYLLVYAAGIWGRRRWALPMGMVYAAYVILNLILFPFRTPHPPGIGYQIFGVVYAAVAIGVSVFAVRALRARRDSLR